MFANGAKNCRYAKFVWGGGKIDAVMTCNHEGSEGRMAFTGDYTADSYHTKMTMQAPRGPGGEAMNMVLSTSSRRVGECTGKEINRKG
jgi:hypothetical protein